MSRPQVSDRLRRNTTLANPDNAGALVPDPKESPESLRRTNIQTRNFATRRRSIADSLGFQSYGTNLTTTLQQDLGSCVVKLRAYRTTLAPDALTEFDAMWGFDATGEFHAAAENGARSWLTAISGDKGDVQQRITDDLINVRKSVDEEIVLLKKCSNNKEKGMRMLLLFQQDLLSGAKGDILAAKGKRDMYVQTERTFGVKLFAWTVVLLINFLMFTYIVLFALQQTQARQGAWAKSFVVWLISEIFFVSTGVCFLMHCMIPLLVMRDLEKCKRRLMDNIRDFKDSQRKESDESKENRFNAASFFFVSHRVAELFPNLRESKIILHFKTQWPKNSYVVKDEDVKTSYNSVGQALGRSVSMIVLQLLGGLVSVGPAIQDAIMELFSTFVIGYTVLIHIRLYNFNLLFVLFPSIVCLLIGHFLVQWNAASSKLRALKNAPQKTPAKHNLNKPWNKKLYPGDVGWVGDLERGRSPSVGSGTEGYNNKALPMPGVENMHRGMSVVEKLQAKQERSFQKSVAKAASRASPSTRNVRNPEDNSHNGAQSSNSSSSLSSSSISSVSSSSSDSSDSSDSFEDTTFQAALSKAPKQTIIRPAESTSAHAIIEPLESVTARMQRMADQKLQQVLAQPVRSLAPVVSTAQELMMHQMQEQMQQMQLMHQKQISMLSAQIGMQAEVPVPARAQVVPVSALLKVAAAGGGGSIAVNVTTNTNNMASTLPTSLSSTAHLASAAERIAKSMELKIQAKLAKSKKYLSKRKRNYSLL